MTTEPMYSKRVVAGLLSAWATAFACSSPQPQSGTNTNWACKVDADCAALSSKAKCEQGRCAAPQGAVDSGGPFPRESSSPSPPDGGAPPSNPDATVNPGGNDGGCTPLLDYTPCGPNNTMQCIDGVCSHCGDQTVQSNEGEECDTGDRIDDDGCDHNCKFSCHGDADCADNDFCNGIEKCTTVTDGARTAKKCTAGTPRNDGEVCGTQRIC